MLSTTLDPMSVAPVPPAVAVTDLAKTFRTGNGLIRAIDCVNLQIAAGQVVALLGPEPDPVP